MIRRLHRQLYTQSKMVIFSSEITPFTCALVVGSSSKNRRLSLIFMKVCDWSMVVDEPDTYVIHHGKLKETKKVRVS